MSRALHAGALVRLASRQARAARAEMCRIPLNPALNAVYFDGHTKVGEAACC
jgi:hypothetical protein